MRKLIIPAILFIFTFIYASAQINYVDIIPEKTLNNTTDSIYMAINTDLEV
jgi:hypothetical protein